MNNAHVHPVFAGMLEGFARVHLAGSPAIVIRGRAPVIHLAETRSSMPLCGNGDADDEISTDPREVTCRSCQLALPLPSAA